MNLNYRFMVDAVDAREAADPVMVLFKDDYYLFASRSGGYWWSNDIYRKECQEKRSPHHQKRDLSFV